MINIISLAALSDKVSGPRKVFANAVKGLEAIGYPYVVNRSLDSTHRTWIQHGRQALPFVKRSSSKTIIGPNTAVLPADVNPFSFPASLYIQPSPWAASLWEQLGFSKCPIQVWPVGIDTSLFTPSTGKQSGKTITVYFKQRSTSDLNRVITALNARNLNFNLIPYGNYSEEEYRLVLSNTSFLIWLGCHESQGIALLEALSCDIPILVCDVSSVNQCFTHSHLFHSVPQDHAATSAPYFNSTCGIISKSLSTFNTDLDTMLDVWSSFSPRSFIVNNLTLEHQAYALVRLWEHWDLSFEQGTKETLMRTQPFRVPLSYIFRRKLARLFALFGTRR